MNKWLRRLRGAFGMGLTWAVGWSGVGAMVSSVNVLVFGGRMGGMVESVIAFTMAGFVGGAAFSVVLGIAEGRRRFDQMSLPRFAAWGAAGGLALSALMFNSGGGALNPGDLLLVGLVILTAAGSAAGSLVLARRAKDELLPPTTRH